MKDTFYFSHDYNARSDEKIKRLIRKHNMQGYGIYWAIIEDLYNNANALQTHSERNAIKERKGKENKGKENKDIEILDSFSFNEFWNLYDYKKERPKCEILFSKLSQKEKELIFLNAPNYIISTPDKKFRKHPQTWLKNKCWNDEITLNEKTENERKKQQLNHFANKILGINKERSGNSNGST